MRHNIAEISAMLAARVLEFCHWLLPSGAKMAHEWCVGSTRGEKGTSLRINLGSKAGVWKDFADSGKGGDLIDLLMACRGYSKAAAVEEAKAFLSLKDSEPGFTPERKKYKLPDKPKCQTPKSAVLAFMQSRGISDSTLKAYRVGEQDGNVVVFPYLQDGLLKFVKFRSAHEKKFWASKDSEPVLFGWQVIPEDARMLIITEGEIDSLSFYEQGMPALSIPFGGEGDGKQDSWIASEWERLLMFDTIYLALDNDAPGDNGAEYIAQRLGRHRCRRVRFGQYKDANQAHMDGADLASFIQAAQSMDPPELRSASDFLDDVIRYFQDHKQQSGYKLPWTKTHDNVGFRKSEISVWGGYNGAGKSQVLGHVLVDSVQQGQRWCVASMEFKPHVLLARLYRQASGLPKPGPDQCLNVGEYFDTNLYLFDVQGTAKAERILEIFDYAHKRYGCDSFLVDSLAKCGFGEDDYNGQKSFVDRLMEFAQANEVHVHLVAHARKGRSEDETPGKMDIKGTGAITDMVDNVYIIWRNKGKEAAQTSGDNSKIADSLNKPDCIITCSKQRNGEWEGFIKLWFDKASLQYLEYSNTLACNYAAEK